MIGSKFLWTNAKWIFKQGHPSCPSPFSLSLCSSSLFYSARTRLFAKPARTPASMSQFVLAFLLFFFSFPSFYFPLQLLSIYGRGIVVEDGNIRVDNLRVERVKLGGGGGGRSDRSWRKIVSDVRFEYLWEFVSRLCFSFSQTRRVVERVFQKSFGIRCLTVFLSSFCCWYISMESDGRNIRGKIISKSHHFYNIIESLWRDKD